MKLKNVSLFCVVVTIVLLFAHTQAPAAESPSLPNVYTYKVGLVEVSFLCDGLSTGNTANLKADEAVLKKYAPDGTYPSSMNAFLIRTPESRILVDSGLGREIVNDLKSLGVEAEDIDVVLLTHMHGDHIGGLISKSDGKAVFPKAKMYLARQERDYWASEEIMKTFPEDRQGDFKNSQAVLAAYGNSVQTFEPDALGSGFKPLLPNVQAIAAFGHTPGHTIFLVESEGAKFLIWGDVTHAITVQMPVPEVFMVFDVDSAQAVATRLAVLKYVSDGKIPVAGAHIRYPGMGLIAPAPEGGYSFTPFP